MTRELGFGDGVAGLVVGVQSLATLLTRAHSGRTVDALGPKATLLRGLAACSGAGWLYLLSCAMGDPTAALAILLAGRATLGVGEKAGKVSHEVAYAVTSLSPEHADPDTLLELWRDHWLIENRLHWRRDVTLREDLGSIRSGTSPRALAALRNTMLAIVHDAAEPLTEIREIFAENRPCAIAAAVKGVL